MWNRREIKSKGRKNIKKHYWRTVAICFLVAFIGGQYSESLSAVRLYDSASETGILNADTEHFGRNDVEKLILKWITGEKKTEDNVVNNPYTRGVFSSIYNHTISAGSLVMGISATISNALFTGRAASVVMMFIGLLLTLLWWGLIKNVLNVGRCRFFLEAVTYNDTPMRRVLFLYRVQRVWKAAKVSMLKIIYQTLWSFTIVGGWIKEYAYRMVPYIVAENPDISPKDAIALSQNMMRGNKWQAFLLDCSFLGWSVLSFCTGGLVNIFYGNSYRESAMAQLYITLREQAIAEEMPLAEYLNDSYLTKPFVQTEDDASALEQYPTQLFTIPEYERRQWFNVDYNCTYGLWGLILLFFAFSFVGWLWEVGLHIVEDGVFVNRGFFHGPWLPIYGSGAVLVLILLKPVRNKPILTFFLTVVICGVVEYTTSWALEVVNGTKWWDYSGYFLNLNGRICAEGLLVFGVGGCACIYVAAPLLNQMLIRRVKLQTRIAFVLLLLSVFFADFVYSSKNPNTGEGITDYAYEAPALGRW